MLPQNWRYMTLIFILHVPSSNYILIVLFCRIWYLKKQQNKNTISDSLSDNLHFVYEIFCHFVKADKILDLERMIQCLL